MDKNILIPLVEKIQGCTFATLDALTEPKPGIMCRVTGERVIIFRTNGKSGWEGMIKRRLQEAGKDPDTFNVGSLPWGTRLGNLPIIEYKGNFYLQTIPLKDGQTRYYMMGVGVDVDPKAFGIRPNRGYLGLPPEETVRMNTYKIDNILRLTLMGETIGEQQIVEKGERAILSMKFPKN